MVLGKQVTTIRVRPLITTACRYFVPIRSLICRSRLILNSTPGATLIVLKLLLIKMFAKLQLLSARRSRKLRLRYALSHYKKSNRFREPTINRQVLSKELFFRSPNVVRNSGWNYSTSMRYSTGQEGTICFLIF